MKATALPAWRAVSECRTAQTYEIKVVPLRETGRAVEADTPKKVVAYVREHVFAAPWFDPGRESLVALFMDTRRRITGFTLVSIGTLDSVLSHPREVFRAAIVANASAVVIAHNHPSGDPSPSPNDIWKTRELLAAGLLLKIEVLDHIILGERRLDPAGTGYCSLRERGCFNQPTTPRRRTRRRRRHSRRSPSSSP